MVTDQYQPMNYMNPIANARLQERKADSKDKAMIQKMRAHTLCLARVTSPKKERD